MTDPAAMSGDWVSTNSPTHMTSNATASKAESTYPAAQVVSEQAHTDHDAHDGVDDRERGLGGRYRAGMERVLGQHEAGQPHDDDRVGLPMPEDLPEAGAAKGSSSLL